MAGTKQTPPSAFMVTEVEEIGRVRVKTDKNGTAISDKSRS